MIGEIPATCQQGVCGFDEQASTSCVTGRLLLESPEPIVDGGVDPIFVPAPGGTPIYVFSSVPNPSCEVGSDDPESWGSLLAQGQVDEEGVFCIEFERLALETDPLPEMQRYLQPGFCSLPEVEQYICNGIPLYDFIDHALDPDRSCAAADCIDLGDLDLLYGCPVGFAP
jgi:hypothetical protein